MGPGAEPVVRARPGQRRRIERRSLSGVVRRPGRRPIPEAAASAGRGTRQLLTVCRRAAQGSRMSQALDSAAPDLELLASLRSGEPGALTIVAERPGALIYRTGVAVTV